MAQLVGTIRMLLDTDGWHGWGIQSPEHWVCWKAAVSRHRARGLVQVARRMHELPACWALFEQGRITEDAIVRIARRVPASHDADVARKVPNLLINQLDRALAACPPLPDELPSVPPERQLIKGCTRDGWQKGAWSVPADEGAVVDAGLTAARDAEYRDRQGLDPDADLSDVPEHLRRQGVTWADALVRMASEAADALDPSLLARGHGSTATRWCSTATSTPTVPSARRSCTWGPPSLSRSRSTCPATPRSWWRLRGRSVHRHHALGTRGEAGAAPSARAPRSGLRSPVVLAEALAPHPPHRVLGARRAHGACEPHLPLSDAPPRPPPRRVPDRGQPRRRVGPLHRRARETDRATCAGAAAAADLCQPSPFRSPDGERLSTLWFSWN